ncbi:hypothetical protein LNJ05_12460 [Tenacibaculum finnmarkense genomovar ulcerans]|uniref:hypothetical protein n=1 Tax=Tenacibaculum finnmarkense TaxID=2781243 RepID=UPI001E3A0323|nr:hypothetical protein [Tenacibaculum finnmarkense]MCD8433575.1 hypothetical protein [Tenacibaculum finnmarkense genomovar ulcerans]
MTNFEQTDIEPLDFIISQSLLKYNVKPQDLIEKGLIVKNNDNEFEFGLTHRPVSEFVRYMYIISEFGVLDCNFNEDCESARKNSKTLHFQKQGGFKKVFADLIEKSNLTNKKSKLEINNLELQKENLEYQKDIREQNDRIRNLTEELKLISLIQKYWWLIGACIGLGWFLGEILEKI